VEPDFIKFHALTAKRATAYELALDLVTAVHELVDEAPIRIGVKDQLDKSATGIAMMLAHVLEDVPSRRWRTYRAALHLAQTCETCLDIACRQNVDVDGAKQACQALRAELHPLAHGH